VYAAVSLFGSSSNVVRMSMKCEPTAEERPAEGVGVWFNGRRQMTPHDYR